MPIFGLAVGLQVCVFGLQVYGLGIKNGCLPELSEVCLLNGYCL